MQERLTAENWPDGWESGRSRQTLVDVILIVLLAAGVIAISATAPASTYAGAQSYQIDSVLDAAGGGDWLLPRSHVRGLDRKPPLYVWLDAPLVRLTGLHDDFVWRVPTVAALVLAALMVYGLGRRWYGRSVGLLAAGLWLTAIHMGRLSYMALTDMTLTAALTASVVCADRLLFHRRGLRRDWLWAAGFWAAFIVGALAKGWGLVNGALVGGFLLLAVGLRNGLRAPPRRSGWSARWRAGLLLVVRRWRRAVRKIHLGYGLAACAAVLAPLLALMWYRGGTEFRQVIYMEFWQRLSGAGDKPPRPTFVPAFLQLLYYQFPTSFFAIVALFMVKPRRWLRGSSPIFLPLCWIVAVVLPFSLAHGFRPDYLLPCYAAVALMGAWAIDHLARVPVAEHPRFNWLRHAFAGMALLSGLLLILLSANFLLGPYMTHGLREVVHIPKEAPPFTGAIVMALLILGIAVVVLAVRASLSWQVRRLALLTIVAMLGLLFIDRHIVCRPAITCDGDTMRNFARAAGPILGDQPYCLCEAEETSVPLYLDRWAERVVPPSALATILNGSAARWLIISDRGLVEAGAAIPGDDGAYRFWANDVQYKFEPRPEDLGKVVLSSSRYIQTRETGRLYLVDLARPLRVTGTPVNLRKIPGWTGDRDHYGEW